MKRISAKMKLLSLAILGLGSIALAGTASAQTCPSTPSAWSATNAFGGGAVSVITGGLDGSSCAMAASVANNMTSFATVVDSSPNNEPRYRVQFLIDPSALGTLGLTDFVQVFNASSAASYPATNGTRQMLSVVLAKGGSGIVANVIVACNNAATFYRCTTSTPVFASGVNRLEFDLQVGASGQMRYWLNAPAGTTEPTPDGTLSVDNAGWVGVDTASMGLSTPSSSFASAHAGQAVKFDTFDSRRSTYIGH